MVKRSRALMYVQKTKYLASKFKNKDDIINHLKKHFSDAEWAYILHNKDVEKTGVKTDDHIHIAFYFPNARSPKNVASIMGDEPQSVEVFTGRWAKQNMFAYLIHATDEAVAEGKHRYSEYKVTANFDYIKFMNNVQATAKSKKLDIEDIQARIISGDLILKDFFVDGKLGDASVAGLFYTNNKQKIVTAIETRYKILMSSKEDMDLEIIYIQGPAGSGKTTIAKEYALRKYGDYFITGSSNDAVQDYMGEPVAIFDDARPSDFNASDWLKLLDPYNNKSTVASRYYNKYLAVKCIILTTTTPFKEFFLHAEEEGGVKEPIDQFLRRFNVVMNVSPHITDDGEEMAHVEFWEVYKRDEPYKAKLGDRFVKLQYDIRLLEDQNRLFKLPKQNNAKKVQSIAGVFDGIAELGSN